MRTAVITLSATLLIAIFSSCGPSEEEASCLRDCYRFNTEICDISEEGTETYCDNFCGHEGDGLDPSCAEACFECQLSWANRALADYESDPDLYFPDDYQHYCWGVGVEPGYKNFSDHFPCYDECGGWEGNKC